MDVKDFEYIVEIAKQGSISRAAANLYVSQSALSKFVMKLEENMGTQLFNRIGKRFVPTCAGERCLEASRQILKINEQMNREIYDISHLIKGKIRLGFHSSRSNFFMSSVFPEYKKNFPDIELQVSEKNSSRECLNMLENGELDLAIVTINDINAIKRQFCYDIICKEELVLAVPGGHPLLELSQKKPGYRYPYIDFKEIGGYSLIVGPQGKRTRKTVDDLCKKYGIVPTIFMEIQTRENLLRAVANGLGIGFTLNLPKEFLFEIENIVYLSFEQHNEFNLGIVYNKNSYLSNAEKLLINTIKSKGKT